MLPFGIHQLELRAVLVFDLDGFSVVLDCGLDPAQVFGDLRQLEMQPLAAGITLNRTRRRLESLIEPVALLLRRGDFSERVIRIRQAFEVLERGLIAGNRGLEALCRSRQLLQTIAVRQLELMQI